MDLACYVINAVVVEGRSVAEVAASHDISRSWLYELLARYREQGDDALKPGSRRPRSSPTQVASAMEDDRGAAQEPQRRGPRRRRSDDPLPPIALPPSTATGGAVSGDDLAHPVPTGLVVPQPHKRPRSSWKRFQAELPNECWQADTTHWTLADGGDVEILNVVDDHSRVLVASRAFVTTKAADVVETFHLGVADHGLPASMLTDKGAIFTAESRHGRCAMENELARLGVAYKHSRPYHPQTCGKVERFHQTLKRWLAKQPRSATLAELQAQLDRFGSYYNEVRPHRALGRRTPTEAFAARTKAVPRQPSTAAEAHHRVRRDRIDRGGRVTLRYRSRLLHIGIGRARRGASALAGQRPRRPGRHRARGAPPALDARSQQGLPTPGTNLGFVRDVSRQPSGMSCDITLERTTGFEPATLTLAI